MLFVPELIAKKRDGHKLSQEEINYLIAGYVEGKIPDYQMAAFLMAVYFRGMDPEETTHLTMAMAQSGEVVDLTPIPGTKVDKHSTGGIGDTTTLVLLPLVAAAGVRVAKMSGRGLGHTGGTIDKLESIPGFSTALSRDQFLGGVEELGVAITGQSENLVPADKLLYALRDVTATVDSIPLIASSIMGKKIAGGSDKIVLDVKFGRGAFIKEYHQALELAERMVEIGKLAGREVVALVTDMDQPLGLTIGNSLEVIEAFETLQGRGHPDLLELCLELGTEMLLLAGREEDRRQARATLEELIETGRAVAKLGALIARQGGDPRVLTDYSILPQAQYQETIRAKEDLYIRDMDPLALGLTAMKLGAGRQAKEDTIDRAVGIRLYGKIGDQIKKGEPVAQILANDQEKLSWARDQVRQAITFGPENVEKRKVIWARIP